MTEILSEEVELEVPFHDVDQMGVAWHGHYVKYLEIARTALMRRLGLDFPQMSAADFLFPVVECHLKYIRPLRYGQRVRVRAELQEYQNRLKVGYVISDAAMGTRLNTAHTVQLAVRASNGELAFELPPVLLEAIARCLP